MAAHEEAVQGIVAAQQTYAGTHDLAGIFEALTLHLIFTKPSNPLEFIAMEANKLKGTKQFEPPLPGREVDTEENVKSYLADNNVNDILEELFASVLFNQPPEPLDFIASECTRLKSIKGGKGVSRLWTDADLRAMHSLYDPGGRGVISRAQVLTALRNLAVRTTSTAVPDSDAITADAFVALARAAIDAER